MVMQADSLVHLVRALASEALGNRMLRIRVLALVIPAGDYLVMRTPTRTRTLQLLAVSVTRPKQQVDLAILVALSSARNQQGATFLEILVPPTLSPLRASSAILRRRASETSKARVLAIRKQPEEVFSIRTISQNPGFLASKPRITPTQAVSLGIQLVVASVQIRILPLVPITKTRLRLSRTSPIRSSVVSSSRRPRRMHSARTTNRPSEVVDSATTLTTITNHCSEPRRPTILVVVGSLGMRILKMLNHKVLDSSGILTRTTMETHFLVPKLLREASLATPRTTRLVEGYLETISHSRIRIRAFSETTNHNRKLHCSATITQAPACLVTLTTKAV